MSSADPVLDTLFRPFQEGELSWTRGDVLFLRARDGIALRQHSPDELICQQSFKPDAEALERAGFVVDNSESQQQFSRVLVLPPRQREEARALLARAILATKIGGVTVASAANDAGAKSQENDLATLGGPLSILSKSKCRVFWTGPRSESSDARLLTEWRELDAPRPIGDGKFTSRPGVFAWDRIDVASELLARHLPSTLKGVAADFGAGFGYLSAELLARCPLITQIDLYEAEERALNLARLNLKGHSKSIGYFWHDVVAGVSGAYDVIVTNPPFHTQGGNEQPGIGRRFIAAAAQALKPGGRLWLVANRHLPYESILDAQFGTVRVVTQAQGFKIIEAIKSSSVRS